MLPAHRLSWQRQFDAKQVKARPPIEQVVRFLYKGKVFQGLLEGGLIRRVPGFPLETSHVLSNGSLSLQQVELLLPVDPHQVLGIGRNHPCSSDTRPDRPSFFAKSRSALCRSSDLIILPDFASAVLAEAELAVVIDRQLSKVSPEQAAEGIAGVLLANDVTALPVDPWCLFECKGADTFAPVSDAVIRGLDIDNVTLTLELNGKTIGQGSTRDLFRSPRTVVSILSQFITLMPGDLVFTGAVALSPPLQVTDEVAITIPGITRVENVIGRSVSANEASGTT